MSAYFKRRKVIASPCKSVAIVCWYCELNMRVHIKNTAYLVNHLSLSTRENITLVHQVNAFNLACMSSK